MTTRITLAALSAAVLAGLESYAPALLLLVGCVLGDYITGMVSAWMGGALSSVEGVKGFVRKLCYFLGVAAGFGVDLALSITTANLGIGIDIPPFFGLLCTMLLAINELISALENLSEIGVPMPAGIRRALASLQEKLEVGDD